MAINTVTIQVRRGNYEDFDMSKMRPGELAVVLANDPSVTSGKSIYFTTSAGICKRLMTRDDLQDEIGNALSALTEEMLAEINSVLNAARTDEAARAQAEGERENAENKRQQNSDKAIKDIQAVQKTVEDKLAAGEFKGDKGDKGDTGAAGKDGTSVTIIDELDSVEKLPETGATGDSYIIEGYLWTWVKSGIWKNLGEFRGPVGPAGKDGVAGPKGDTGPVGPAGKDGTAGPKGDTGNAGIPGEDGISVTHEWNGTILSVTSASGTSSVDLKGAPGNDGTDAATFIPHMTADGVLSWSNDGGLTNPKPINIKGPKGDNGSAGKDGSNGTPGEDGVSVSHSWNGTELTLTSASGTTTTDLKGEKGETGADGKPGTDAVFSSGTTELIEGISTLETGSVYFVYE